ncbi:MAG: hypothetical protein JNK85_07735 [Verrucomicrobiales bacterium]|nr:hypothetical protein [Verrucomicrobiales bacterium]
MSESPIQNLRVHIYGAQGSGSVFPSRAERLALLRHANQELVACIIQDLSRHLDPQGRLSGTIEDILEGPISPRTIARYAGRFDVTEPRVYGGWTTCVRVTTADGFEIVLDCGSGFRICARDLQAQWAELPERHLHLFGSHSHLDHTEGFDQAAVCFDPRNHLHIYGNRQFLRALDYNLGIFSRQVARAAQGVQTPIHFGLMPATFASYEIGALPAAEADGPPLKSVALRAEEAIHLGATTILPFEVFHPAPCLAYRIEREGRVFVFCTDHEWRREAGEDAEWRRSQVAEDRLIAYATGADLLYRDGQYLRAEYEGLKGIGDSGAVPRIGWGHSCIEDVVEMARKARIHRTLIGHHDPNRSWSELNWLDESISRHGATDGCSVELARAETEFDL